MSFPLSDFIIDLDPVIEKKPLDLFEEKYKPTCEDEFFGNELAIQKFKNWDRNMHPLCIVSGERSSGKTTFVDLMLKDYEVAEYSDNMERKELFKNIFRLIDVKSVLSQISDKNKPTAVLIDNAETFLGDGKNFDEFCNIVEKSCRNVPIVLTVSKIKKKMNKKTRFLLIDLQPTNVIILNKVAKRIINGEKLKVDNISKSRIIEKCNNDVRQLMHLLKMMTYSNEKIDITSVERLVEFSTQDKFYEASSLVDRIYNKTGIEPTETMEYKMILYDGEHYSTEQLLYSNLNKVSDIDVIASILDGMSSSTILQKTMYELQEWDFKDYSLLETCVKSELLIPFGNYKIGKNCINNLQLNISKNQTAIDKLKINYEDSRISFELKKHYMEIDKCLEIGIDYETYSKLCNIYNLSKKTKKYFENDN